MHPEIEIWLEQALESVRPTSDKIGRVVVEPDYNVGLAEQDARPLAGELEQYLRKHTLDEKALASHEGFEIEIPHAYPLLAKYIRRITLHRDKADGAWVEVAPPGNWI